MAPFKKALLFCHRWLGLISGLVVFIVSITGCIFCFQDEIQDAIYDYRTVQNTGKPYVQPSQLINEVKKAYPKASPDFIYYYGAGRPAGVLANLGKEGYEYVFLDPYTGKITYHEKPQTNFFIIVEYIHLYLLLPPAIGKWIVGVSVIIFMVIMVTGLILWWPKRKTDRKRSFTIKWGGRWRRVNYDLHNVLGFYATAIAMILAISGLAIAFEPVSKAIYATANVGTNIKYKDEVSEPKSDSLKKAGLAKQPVIDIAFAHARQQSPKAEMFLIHNDPAVSGAIGVGAYPESMHYASASGYEFDKYNGKLLKTYAYDKKSPGLKLNEMNYDIHVGQIFGLATKIIAFLVSLICASLPVTGFIIWLGKRKKNKSKTTKVRGAVHHKTHRRAVQGA
ncbi:MULTISPECIES: PepSY-associated TM helix domain-containing protein [unclassified Mucilaginibacter]|uniref:PepSY-associated TM helix domain-containing protein n=1 Tax=unclassified Mucilaginibacter TaxID=2617802 RepID=UPI002AC93EE7|nr:MULTISPECIES: PepSY-associated TM helix domain-containing protein [unclassified Mucilaginibacter]MEB0248558.1 PepSY-associated TM helix domain-containing protein [Mucilaginibacter sp. 5B2]MEB0263011.1 PepSY-associated TM helix domain-containing protein [Mucilaginibacter sp. 10I4]MEB0279661.1 PepSY-associated TM helix domain-containing protein [Mucilaginibacter sp. 10B2]MEB0302958.1 PepSY-associated TM helix domain-containing protein [Mucilaginibacter sp. 5C4]WPX23779.1 PepSY-associated TM h